MFKKLLKYTAIQFFAVSLFFLSLFSIATHAASLPSTLIVCLDSSPEGFDVVRYNTLVTTNATADPLMNRLVEYDVAQAKIVPSLAKNWETSADGLVYTFHLVPNIPFHRTSYFQPSRTLTADDVVFSFQRMLNPKHPWYQLTPTGFPHAQSLQLSQLIRSVNKLDTYTVQFVLNMPQATFLSILSMGFASIYSEEYASKLIKNKQTAQLNAYPIGTGPFIFRSFQKDSMVRYDVNPSYPKALGKTAKIQRLLFAIVPDTSIRLRKIKANECQIALAPKPQDIVSAQKDPALRVLATSAFMTAFIALNTHHIPLNNQLVRQAINLAFDKNAYLKIVFDGTATRAINPYPPTTWSYARQISDYVYDSNKAKQLLAQAGYPQGFKTTIWTRSSSGILNPNPQIGAALLQADLEKVGIKAEIKTIEWGELIRRAKAGEHDLLFMGWAGDNGDPDNFLSPQFSCAAVQSGTNFSRYCSKTLDQLIKNAVDISGSGAALQERRSNFYVQAQQIIKQQALWVPLAHPNVSVLVRKNISGYQVNPFGRQDFSQVAIN